MADHSQHNTPTGAVLTVVLNGNRVHRRGSNIKVDHTRWQLSAFARLCWAAKAPLKSVRRHVDTGVAEEMYLGCGYTWMACTDLWSIKRDERSQMELW